MSWFYFFYSFFLFYLISDWFCDIDFSWGQPRQRKKTTSRGPSSFRAAAAVMTKAGVVPEGISGDIPTIAELEVGDGTSAYVSAKAAPLLG